MTLPSTAWAIALGGATLAALGLFVKFQGPFMRWHYDRIILSIQADMRDALRRGDLDAVADLRQRMLVYRRERNRW